MAGLTAADFTVVVDGAAAPIARFVGAPEPLTVAVLVDVTASMPPSQVEIGAGLPSSAKPGRAIPVAVEEFRLRGLRSNDRVRVGAVCRQLMMSDAFSTDARERQKDWHAVFTLPPIAWLGPSPIWDAIAAVASAMAHEPGQRAILFVTDALGSGNVLSSREAAERAALTGVAVNFVLPAGWRLPTSVEQNNPPFRGLGPVGTALAVASETGGIIAIQSALESQNIVMDRADTVERMINRLHHAYALGFVASADGRTHALEVRVAKPGVTVHARAKYQ